MCLFRIPNFGYETTVVTILEHLRGNTRCRNFSISYCRKNIWAGSATKKMNWIYMEFEFCKRIFQLQDKRPANLNVQIDADKKLQRDEISQSVQKKVIFLKF